MTLMSRRSFVQSGGLLAMTPLVSPWIRPGNAAGALTSTPEIRHAWRQLGRTPTPDREQVRAITARGLDAARAAGAEYADVRLTSSRWVQLSTRVERPYYGGVSHMFYSRTFVAAGVRALVNGCWGYASHSVWSLDDIPRLATEAVGAARASLVNEPRQVKLAPTPVVADGDWTTPIAIDPFTIPIDEIMDEMAAMGILTFQYHREVSQGSLQNEMTRDYRAFASTEGSFTTQTLYRTGGELSVSLEPHWRTRIKGGRTAESLTVFGGGWDAVLNAPIRDELPGLIEEADRTRFGRDVDIGRYDVVFDPKATGNILAASLGSATDLVRAMEYDANVDGTSFLDDPLNMVGSLKVASPLVTITGDRTMPGGAATVKWDDEGVNPEEFTIVRDGRLHDFQTNRESASWLSEYYQKNGLPVKSHACTGSDTAERPLLPQQPNLTLLPGSKAIGLQHLSQDIERGYLVLGGRAHTDHQCITGYMPNPVVFEIRNGKVGDVAFGAGVLFNTTELWNNIDAIGGAGSVRALCTDFGKTYKQRAMRTMKVPPIRVKNVAIVDMRRKMV